MANCLDIVNQDQLIHHTDRGALRADQSGVIGLTQLMQMSACGANSLPFKAQGVRHEGSFPGNRLVQAQTALQIALMPAGFAVVTRRLRCDLEGQKEKKRKMVGTWGLEPQTSTVSR